MSEVKSTDGLVSIDGYDVNIRILERLLTNNADFAKAYRALIRKALQEARRRISNDIKFTIGINKDPRAAYKAVKTTVYKSIFGGNISILNRKKASGTITTYHAPKTLISGQRGGNRVPISKRTLQVNSYYGVDRGFILRWLETGLTKTRVAGTRGGKLHGNRGTLPGKKVFSKDAGIELEKSVQEVSDALVEYINKIVEN